jgi:hypothetical protein
MTSVGRGPISSIIAVVTRGCQSDSPIRSSQATRYVLESNSTFVRMLFTLSVESCTNDHHAIERSGGVVVKAECPNDNAHQGRSRVFCVNLQSLTESGMAIKPDDTGGRSSNSR